MATGIVGSDELEVLPLEDSPTPSSPEAPASPRRRRRWWWLVPLVAVLALAIALPVRAAVGRAELRGLEGRWRAGQTLITDGFAQISQLRAAAGPSFASVIPAVFQEQADDLQPLVDKTRAQLVLDPPLTRLRRQMVQALRAEAADLRGDAQYWRGPNGSPEPAYLTARSFDAQARVERTLSSQLQRLSLPPAVPRSIPRLRAPQAALARLNRIADEPIGVRLVGSTSRGLLTIDIDHNRIDPLHLTGSPNLEVIQLVPRQGFVVIRAFGSDGAGSPVDQLFAVSSTFTGPVTDLGPLEALRPDVNVPDPRVIPGERPDTFWVRKPDGSALEYDGTFRVVRGPVALRPEDELRGATAAGLFVGIRAPSGQSFSLEIIDPAQPARPSRLVGTGVPLTACGNQLIWFQNDDRGLMHVTDSVSGHDLIADPGLNMRPDGEWACSPEGTRVAGTWFSLSSTPRDVPGVVDLSTGRLELTTGGGLDTQPGATSIVWTPAGDRVFLLGALASGRGPDPMTFRPGDTDIAHLRLPGQILDAIVPLP